MLSRPNIVMNHGRPAAGQAVPAGDRRREAQRGEVDQAAPVRRLQRVRVALEPRRRRRATASRSPRHVRRRRERPVSAATRAAPRRDGRRRARSSSSRAAAIRMRERQAPARRPSRGVVAEIVVVRVERLALVAEHEAVAAERASQYVPFFSSASLTSNRSAKSLPASIRTVESTGFSSWLRIVSSSGKPSPTAALPDHRELRVDVDGAGAGDEEEPRLEVLQVVGRQRVQPLAVDRQHPARQEPGVEREQPGRIGQRRLDVAALVADDERVAVEDLDQSVAHRRLLPVRARGAAWRSSLRRSIGRGGSDGRARAAACRPRS